MEMETDWGTAEDLILSEQHLSKLLTLTGGMLENGHRLICSPFSAEDPQVSGLRATGYEDGLEP